jgi:uncharacterized protein YqhQ
MLPILESGEETLVGGQAVMEGVMMRAPHSLCVSVRKASGEIVSEEMPVQRPSEKYPVLKMPVLRGLGVLGQAMGLGLKALQFSASVALEDENAASPAGPAKEKPAKEKKDVSKGMMGIQILFSLAFFIFLYKFVPLKLTEYIAHWAPVVNGQILFNAVDGVIRLAIFLAFLFVLSRSSDIHRVFQYHGAEHKVVFNFESRKPLTVENAQSFRTFHPRCGTSFMIVIMLISMVVYMFIPVQGFAAKMAIRIGLLPFIVGGSYELIRFAAKRPGSLLAMLAAPGLWTQRITTKQPSNDQTEVAIHALNGAMALETSQGGELVIA